MVHKVYVCEKLFLTINHLISTYGMIFDLIDDIIGTKSTCSTTYSKEGKYPCCLFHTSWRMVLNNWSTIRQTESDGELWYDASSGHILVRIRNPCAMIWLNPTVFDLQRPANIKDKITLLAAAKGNNFNVVETILNTVAIDVNNCKDWVSTKVMR